MEPFSEVAGFRERLHVPGQYAAFIRNSPRCDVDIARR